MDFSISSVYSVLQFLVVIYVALTFIVNLQINSLSRWEVINKVRTMSTEAARAGEEGGEKLVNLLHP